MCSWEPDIRTTEGDCYSVAVQVNLVAIISFSSPNHHDYRELPAVLMYLILDSKVY